MPTNRSVHFGSTDVHVVPCCSDPGSLLPVDPSAGDDTKEERTHHRIVFDREDTAAQVLMSLRSTARYCPDCNISAEMKVKIQQIEGNAMSVDECIATGNGIMHWLECEGVT